MAFQIFRYGSYVGLRMVDCEIHLCPPDSDGPGIGGGNAYIICDEIDHYFSRIKAAGAHHRREPADRKYGMCDFVICDPVICDPDGNQLSFGCDNDKD